MHLLTSPHSRAKNILRALLLMYGSSVCAPGAPQDLRLREYVDSHSLAELSASLVAGTIWPALDSKSAPDRQLALSFLKRCTQEHARVQKEQGKVGADVYLQLLKPLRKSGGYINAVLEDTVFRFALAEIASTVVHHPERADEMEGELASLQPSPWKSIGIGRLLAEHFHDPSLEKEFATWPEREVLSRVSQRFDNSSPLLSNFSSRLVDNESLDKLIYRSAETEWLFSYALPGLISYIKHGGRLSDLGSSVTPFVKLMGPDLAKFQFKMYGANELGMGDLITLREEFGNTGKQPRFLVSALN